MHITRRGRCPAEPADRQVLAHPVGPPEHHGINHDDHGERCGDDSEDAN
jgi:hypothetical protein